MRATLILVAARNSIKIYSEDGYYHIYNRGVEKRNIFLDEQDYGVFLAYLKEYLLPKDEDGLKLKLSDPTTSYKDREKIIKILRLKNFADEISLLCYCLMPNHFHFLLKQHSRDGIDRFMRSVGTRYAMYFNIKYKRVGSLYQDVYKAVLVETDEQLLQLSKYIHRNPLPELFSATKEESLRGYSIFISQPSSYPDYVEPEKTKWVDTKEILLYFSKTNANLSYQSFVEQIDDHSYIQKLTIDN